MINDQLLFRSCLYFSITILFTNFSMFYLKNLWKMINEALLEVALALSLKFSTAAPSTIETYWENDIIEQMLMTDLLCIVLWVQDDHYIDSVAASTEDFMTRFDSDNVAVFCIPSSTMKEKIDALEKKLQNSKFDGRLRLVVNVNEPVAAVKLILGYPFLRSLPMMVNMSASESPEDSIFILGRLKPDTHFSVKPSDFDKFCAFATALWINYKEDPSRTVVEKKINKMGVVIQKTDSMEKGLRYMDTHRHLGYLDNFRIIIGDGSLNLDDSTESSLASSKKKEFFIQRAAQMRAKTLGGRGKGKKEEEFSTLELVQVLRNRLKWQTPILIFNYSQDSNIDHELFKFNSIKATYELNVLEYFATMKALPWAVELSAFRSETNSTNPGILRIVNLRCNDLVGKKLGSMDLYAIVKVGDQPEKKTKKFSGTSNPTWNLGWEIPCKLTDHIVITLKDKNLFGKNDIEGFFEGSIMDLIPVAIPLVEVTKVIEKTISKSAASTSPSNSPSVSTSVGTITIEIGFRFEGQSERALGYYFGRPLAYSIDLCIRDAIPHLIEKCVHHLMAFGALETEGIFRQPASQRRLDMLKESFDRSLEVDLSQEDVQDVAILLRTYLRELPDPLIPSNMYENFKAISSIEKRRDKLVAITHLLMQLPSYNLESFANIMQILYEISKNEAVNKMPARNLASVLGPALIIPKDVSEDAASYLSATTSVAAVLESCIQYAHKIFTSVDVPAGEGTQKTKRKTQVQTFIDPYLTDSMSSPRRVSGSDSKRSISSELLVTKRPLEGLLMDFVLKEECALDGNNLGQQEPSEDLVDLEDLQVE